MSQVCLLMTGAAGRIGSAFYAEAADRYRFRLADLTTDQLLPRAGHEAVTLDVADLDACHAACVGIDAVLHLAADPSPEADFYDSLLRNNVQGTFNIFRAARDAGARRLVFASSIHAVAGQPWGTPIPTDAPVRPVTLYGATKCFGEAVAAYFAQTEGLSSIAVRIGAYDAPWIHENPTPELLASYVSPRDLNQLFVRALEAPPELDWAVVNGISDKPSSVSPSTRRVPSSATPLRTMASLSSASIRAGRRARDNSRDKQAGVQLVKLELLDPPAP